MVDERAYDVVLFGASGFTGSLTAEYLAKHAHSSTRWALAGRDRRKLEALCERLGIDVPLLHADVTDAASLQALVQSTRVVASTVGPYVRYGEPLVAAAARAGTSYADITGEPEFVDAMYLRHHAAAQQSGARMVHCCGFDSIPHDLGAHFTVAQLPEGQALSVKGYVSVRGRPSGGTLHSAIGILSASRRSIRLAAQRRRSEPVPQGRRVRGGVTIPHHERGLGWALPLTTIDPQIVLRSAKALERYGPDFSYAHHFVAPLPLAVGAGIGAGTFFALAQIPPTRRALLSMLAPGEGPSAERRARSWFKVSFVGEGGGQRVLTQVSGGDPGYTETSKMLAESALCLAHDDLPDNAGQLTPAVAMGEALRARLVHEGITFSVLDSSVA